MVKKKIDNRIRTLIENGIESKHRSMFVVIGDKARDQCVILHHMLSKSQVKARPNVLWCYKKELGFSSHRKKRMKQIQKKIKCGKLDVNDDDPFELFVASTNIRYCYYNETHKILGNTFGMLVLQDFEALTPNLLARTIETVQGGGLVVILLRSLASLKQFYTMSMDVHSRFRTEAHQQLVARFNERFILSLSSCAQCLVVDDQLNILPISSRTLDVQPVLAKSSAQRDTQLDELKLSLQDTQPACSIVGQCGTLDQAKAVLKFIDAVSEKSLRSIVSLTAARGRGKSAALGLSIASAVAYGYSNIFVTSPSPENLSTLFEFVFKGLDALDYQEHIDYELVQSTNPDFNKAIIRVNIYKEHRQTIQYIHAKDWAQLGQAELVVIDEAAAIPLPLVRNLLGPYLVFMASTISGYEGTGRSLSLKLMHQLRQQSVSMGGAGNVELKKQARQSASGSRLHELQLNESIRYANADPIEKWLNDLLCLECCAPGNDHYLMKANGCPLPDTCDLFYVNRDTLFSYHKVSEMFLQRLMALYVSSHYKNTPNDLQMLSDAPAHHIFCLLSPIRSNSLPEILCVVQVCLEGEISRESVADNLQRGKRASGDLIPWTVSQQFQDDDFARLAGARIVRIATHPEYQGMGYGQRAMNLLRDYYEGKMLSLSESLEQSQEIQTVESDQDLGLLQEQIEPRKNLPPLLLKLSERRAEKLSYIGVSFGLTSDLFRFWKKLGFLPVYLRQTANELTGEHSCIVLKELNLQMKEKLSDSWLYHYFADFRRRFISLLAYQFKVFLPSMCLSLMKQDIYPEKIKKITKEESDTLFNSYDFKRLEMYAQNLVDYHLVIDLVPDIARLYYSNKLGEEFNLSLVQSAILLGVGLQKKTVEELEKELQLPPSQLLAMFNKVVKKFISLLEEIQVSQIDKILFKPDSEMKKDHEKMQPLKQSLEEELKEASDKVIEQELERKKQLLDVDLKQYEIKGSEKEWTDALKLPVSGYVTVKRMNEKKPVDVESHFENSSGKNDDFDKPGKKKANGHKFKKNKKIKT